MLLQEVEILSVFLLDFLESKWRFRLRYLITNFKLGDEATHGAVFLVILESASQVFQATFCHTCQTDKDSICNVGPDAMYESRVSWKKIHNTRNYALRYH